MGGFLRDVFGGKDAAKATQKAAKTSVEFQNKALDYLKQTEAPLNYYRQQGMGGIAELLGIPQYQAQPAGYGGMTPGYRGDYRMPNMATNSRDFSMRTSIPSGAPIPHMPNMSPASPPQPADLMQTLQSSPVYSAIMGGMEQGEEAILRNQSATGGLRSGDASYNLADFATNLSNEAMLSAYTDRQNNLKTLMGLPTMAPQIASGTAGIGSTLASGITGAAGAKQQAEAAGWNTVSNLAGDAVKILFSDVRLKDNVERIGERNGLGYYRWEWNDEAAELGLAGAAEGYMAHEVADVYPQAVSESRGYLQINEDMLNG